jgi:GNAT superfamily N-acetyltransferase
MEENDVSDVSLLCTQLGYPSTKEQVLSRMKLLMKDKNHHLFVARTATGMVIGWAHVQGRRSLIADPFAQVSGLVTDEGHRGKGVGRALMDEAEKWARDQGYGDVLLYTNTVRTDAHRFYQRMGYVADKTSYLFHKRF